MRPHPDVIKQLLAAQAAPLAAELLPDGHLEGKEWRGHGPDGAKFGVVVRGPKAGTWQNFGAGQGGRSLLGLVRDCACQGDHLAAYDWACRWLGGEALDVPRPPPPAPRPLAGGRTDNGMRLYLSGEKFSWDGPLGRYLAGRAILEASFPRPIAALRFRADCWNSDLGQAMPAMLAPVVHPGRREQLAVHRTYLACHDGAWTKAAVPKAKKLLGSPVGGLIPLTRGAGGGTLGRLADAEALLLAEGIENALSVAQIYPEYRAAAYVSAGNLAHLALPPQFRSVLLVRDRDGENAPIAAAREAAAHRWQDEGRAVAFWDPPPDCKDANDYWCQVAAGEREE